MKKKGQEKRKGIFCLKCRKKIDTKKDHYVEVATYNREKSPDDHCYFHINCWKVYFDEKALDKAKVMIQEMQNSALQMLNSPMIKSMLSGVKAAIGGDPEFNKSFLFINSKPIIEKGDHAEHGRRKKESKKRS